MMSMRRRKSIVVVLFKWTYRQIFTEVKYEDLNIPTIKCRNVKYLPGSYSSSLPRFLPKNGHANFKAIKVSSVGSMTEVTRNLRSHLDVTLKDFYGILVKGLPISSSEDFTQFTKILDYKNINYSSGNGNRKKLVGNTYTASDHPKEFTIEPHNEMAYIDGSPSKLMLCCLKESTSGGESPIVFNRDIMSDLDKDVVKKIVRKKVRYYRTLEDEEIGNDISWQKTFHVKTKKEAENKMLENGMNWQWLDNGNLSLWNIMSPMRRHPVTGENMWFNQIHASHCSYLRAHPKYDNRSNLEPLDYYLHCTYGDGEEFEDSVIDLIRAAIWNNAVSLKLEKGDVLLVDNFMCLHSRMGYKGDRKVVVQLIQ